MEVKLSRLVLFDRPRFLNIPYFALGAPNARDNACYERDLGDKFIRLVGTRCGDWVRIHKGEGLIKLVTTRTFIPPKTAFYLNWLVFQDDALAEEFLRCFPKYDFDLGIEKLRGERESLELALIERTNRGGFDLSRFSEWQRASIARRYVEIHEKIEDLREYESGIERARGLGEEWQNRLFGAEATGET
jgi:hypothetical protein